MHLMNILLADSALLECRVWVESNNINKINSPHHLTAMPQLRKKLFSHSSVKSKYKQDAVGAYTWVSLY